MPRRPRIGGIDFATNPIALQKAKLPAGSAAEGRIPQLATPGIPTWGQDRTAILHRDGQSISEAVVRRTIRE